MTLNLIKTSIPDDITKATALALASATVLLRYLENPPRTPLEWLEFLLTNEAELRTLLGELASYLHGRTGSSPPIPPQEHEPDDHRDDHCYQDQDDPYRNDRQDRLHIDPSQTKSYDRHQDRNTS